MTLVEMMVASLIGSILVAGAITVYVQSRANYQVADSVARLQDNLRFALDTLAPDIRLAGFWGLHNQPALIDGRAVLVSCTGGAAVQATELALGRRTVAVEARDDAYDLPCPGRSPRAGSDVLILRHASDRTTPVGAFGPGQVYAALTYAGGALFDDALPPVAAAPVEYRAVVFNAYYVGDSGFEPGTPALRRLTLVDGGAQGALQDEELLPGVENLQVQFGLDTDGDGAVDRYVDGDHPLATPERVLALRLWLLLRGEVSEAGLGFIDDRSYQPADANLAPIQPGTDPAYPAGFRRIAVSKTILLRNRQD